MPTYAAMKAGYQNLWAQAHVLPQHEAELKRICERFITNRARYAAVEKATGVPWWWVAIVHERESNCDFSTYLGNGDPLSEPTRHVPRGRGPFPDWQSGAEDSLRDKGLDHVKDWSIPSALYWFEAWNGWGYLSKGENSPYVWALTNLEQRGKYVEDSQFSPSTLDTQPGCAAMLQILLSLVPNLISGAIQMTQPTPAPTAPVTPAPASGITVSTSQNLATHLIAAVGAILAASGFSSVHSLYDLVTSSGVLGGTLVALLAAGISHLNIIGANENTIELVDQIVTKMTPAHQSLMQQAAAMDPNAHPQA